MGLARSTADLLQEGGHDVVHLSSAGLQRLSDSLIVQKSLVENRIILTHDLDFGRIVALSQKQLPSVITFRLSDMRPDKVNLNLLHVIRSYPKELDKGALITVTDRRIRVRQMPITA
jgi:predicted nuclease of predicted toxin-antitoxin system